jgi:hypothetical protein
MTRESDFAGSGPFPPASGDAAIVAATRRWLETAVIGLNLCPFARLPYQGNRIRYAVSAACTPPALAADLMSELRLLAAADPGDIETSLLIHPHVLEDFADYSDFLDVADDVLERLQLTGTLQIASFHPAYRFSGTAADDMGNFTNRSPFPLLHLLREASVERALAAFPEPERIYQRNIEALRVLGRAGWDRLWRDPAASE